MLACLLFAFDEFSLSWGDFGCLSLEFAFDFVVCFRFGFAWMWFYCLFSLSLIDLYGVISLLLWVWIYGVCFACLRVRCFLLL